MNILIVDDDQDTRHLLKLILINSFKIQEENIKLASTGEYAINEKNVDLLLVDVGLPDMSGEKVIEYFANKKTKIIAITGYAKFVNDLCDAIFIKPIDIKYFISVVENFKCFKLR